MQVKSLIMRQMPRYGDIVYRPYNSDLTDRRSIDALVSATAGGQHIDAAGISDVSNRILIPSSKPTGRASIAHGWDEQRFMFMMQVVVNKSPTTQILMVISGYTDHSDYSNLSMRKAHLPRDMRFYFNSTYRVRTMRVQGGRGFENRSTISDSNQILTRTERSNLSQRNRRGTMTMRPEDVIIHNSVSPEFRDIIEDEGNEWRDTRAEFTTGALRLSRRDNTSSSEYLTRTLTALRDADSDDFVHDNEKSIALSARGKVREPLIERDDFWTNLASDSQLLDQGFVTWGELLDMNEDLDDICDIVAGTGTQSLDHRGEARWDETTNEALAATIVKDTIVQYMIENMYVRANFSVTNDTRNGRVETTIGKFVPFEKSMDIEDHMNPFISRVESELFRSLLFHNDMILSVDVDANIFGDIVITVSIDGNEDERFVYPAFCDSIASPVMTNDPILIDEISSDISQIHRTLREHRSDFDKRESRGSNIRERILAGSRERPSDVRKDRIEITPSFTRR